MRLSYTERLLSIIALSLFLFILESAIKYYIILNKIPAQGFYFFNILYIDFFTNENIAFGVPFPQSFTIFLVIIILILLSVLWFNSLIKNNFGQTLGLSLVIIGALSNLIDRLIFGFVIDYINIFIWPVFNLADAMIVIGVIVYFIFEYKYKKKRT